MANPTIKHLTAAQIGELPNSAPPPATMTGIWQSVTTLALATTLAASRCRQFLDGEWRGDACHRLRELGEELHEPALIELTAVMLFGRHNCRWKQHDYDFGYCLELVYHEQHRRRRGRLRARQAAVRVSAASPGKTRVARDGIDHGHYLTSKIAPEPVRRPPDRGSRFCAPPLALDPKHAPRPSRPCFQRSSTLTISRDRRHRDLAEQILV